jgi:type I restriction enzyme M protein
MNSETKRHIDSARQVLVGVVPNPTSQIDQITNALIFKFMDDMDQSAIKAGGKPSFFVGELEKYAWTRIMDPRIGNQERMNMYVEALQKFSESKLLPELFRNIFRSAFLPYRSPEVLGLFLKEINYFDYSHSEELGNAYEYLLSIMSSQGDAGQFRTPRHIIDFMVEVVDPKEDDKVLDPACGTAGFLISAYKHILKKHDGLNPDGSKNIEKPLTPDERKKLVNNFEGYDIDPGMVRIAQVNMYLHQFKNPKIFNYDTLTMEDRWNDKFDVILANPPFMSPKGGVQTHNKFSIQSNRSEVLFVDYFINHLRPRGRAGIIVPEGIIFQSGNAHKQLRKNLVEDGLYAVVSLPSGVFAPYSGVKTSILLFNEDLAKQKTEILFVRVENDGFDLGATKRQISRNDLPHALEILNKWNINEKVEDKLAAYVEKVKIAENGDYNLSGDRYRVTTDYSNVKWPMVGLGEICDVSSGNSAPQEKDLFKDGKYPFFRTSDVGAVHSSDNLKDVRDWLNDKGIAGLRLFKKGTILFPKSGASIFLNHRVIMGFDGYVSSHLATIAPKDSLVNIKYVYQLLLGIDAKSLTADQAYPSLKISEIAKIKIPFPPLEIQEQIVKELESYEKIIAGARQIVASWKPKIDIDPKWEKVKLRKIADYFIGLTYSPEDVSDKGTIVLRSSNIKDGVLDYSDIVRVSKKIKENLIVREGDILMCSRNGSKRLVGKIAIIKNLPEKMTFGTFMTIIRSKYSQFLSYFLVSDLFRDQIDGSETSSINQITKFMLDTIILPLPPPAIQKQIVEKIEAERALVEGNRELIKIYERKIKDRVLEIWGN